MKIRLYDKDNKLIEARETFIDIDYLIDNLYNLCGEVVEKMEIVRETTEGNFIEEVKGWENILNYVIEHKG